MQVGAYARKYRYLQQDHDEASGRLQAVERLLRQYDCATSRELLAAVAEAEADLDTWYQLEGQTKHTLPLADLRAQFCAIQQSCLHVDVDDQAVPAS